MRTNGSGDEGLRALVATAEAGSISAAAKRLGLTPSAVSRRLQRLEEAAGARLFERSTRSLRLTEAGARFLPHAREALLATEEAFAAVQEAGPPNGRLRILSLMGFGRLHLVPLLPAFLQKYPGIELDLILDDRAGLLDDDFDVALRAGDPPRAGLVVRRLATLRSVVCAAPTYLKQHRTPQTLQDLADHRCLVYSYSIDPKHWNFLKDGVWVPTPIVPAYAVNNSDALAEMTCAGLGIARLPTFIAGPLLQTGALVPLLRSYDLASLPLNLLLPSRRYLPRKVRVFIEMLTQAYETPPWEVWMASP